MAITPNKLITYTHDEMNDIVVTVADDSHHTPGSLVTHLGVKKSLGIVIAVELFSVTVMWMRLDSMDQYLFVPYHPIKPQTHAFAIKKNHVK